MLEHCQSRVKVSWASSVPFRVIYCPPLQVTWHLCDPLVNSLEYVNRILLSTSQKAEEAIRQHVRPRVEIPPRLWGTPTLHTHQCPGKDPPASLGHTYLTHSPMPWKSVSIHNFLCSVTMKTSWNFCHVRMWYLGNLKLYFFLTRVTLNWLQNKPSLLFFWGENYLYQYGLKDTLNEPHPCSIRQTNKQSNKK